MRLIVALSFLCAARPVTAQIPDITWDTPETVDAPVADVSAGSGVSIIDHAGDWHVVYEKNGDIVHRVRTSAAWQAATPLSNDPASSRNPHLAHEGTYIHVVWEDDRTGHTEVWSRTMSLGVGWLPETCVTCDGVISRQPVIDFEDGAYAYLAWTESVGGTTQIYGSFIANNVWGAPEAVSASTGSAFEPTVALHPNVDAGTIVWSDTRHGTAEIYSRTRFFIGGWSSEYRVTDFGADSRRASAHSEHCCGINIQGTALVLFDTDVLGTREVFGACVTESGPGGPLLMSPDDGIPSLHAAAGGFDKPVSVCIPEIIDENVYFGAWTDSTTTRTHTFARVACSSGVSASEPVGPGLGNMTVAAREGSPTAEILRVWVEDVGGTPTLESQRGTQIGCSWPGYGGGPAALVLVPDGSIPNVMSIVDTCANVPFGGIDLTLLFSAALQNDVTWDTPADEPPFLQTTNGAGNVTYVLRGGGCSQAGTASLRCAFDDLEIWTGVKSPDIDGNCVVDASDHSYVVSMVGTTDFCADLDGSGFVEGADVFIVDQTLGAECGSTVAIDPAVVSPRPRLTAHPNPGSSAVTFDVAPHAGAAFVHILDVAGRLVRRLGVSGATAQWDRTDERGRAVAPGTYFARLWVEDRSEAIVRLQVIR